MLLAHVCLGLKKSIDGRIRITNRTLPAESQRRSSVHNFKCRKSAFNGREEKERSIFSEAPQASKTREAS